MSSIDDILPNSLAAPSRRPPDVVVKRVVICFILACIEGISAAALVFGAALAYHTIFLDVPLLEFDAPFYSGFSVLTGVVYGSFSASAGARFLDKGRRPLTLTDSFYGWTAAIALTLLAAFLLGTAGDLSRVSLTAAYVLGLPAIISLRSYVQAIMADRIRRGALHFERVSVVGNRVDVLSFLLNGELWRNGHRLTDTLYLEDAIDEQGVVRLNAVTDFARRSLRNGSDHIVFVGDLSDLDGFERMLGELKRFALNVIYAPATMNRTLKFLDVVAIGPNNALRFMRKPMSDTAVILKRTLDICGASAGLILLAPFLVLVAITIAADSPGPVIYRQARRGFNGETFTIWKFRSMSVTESGFAMRQAQPGDARITRLGKLLRSTSVDELPQLVNVLLGHMSLVGPRPHAISHDEELGRKMATYAHRQRIKPGITGWAQVNGYRGDTSTPQSIEGRVLHDIFYIDNWSIFLDLWILALTVFSPAARRNAR